MYRESIGQYGALAEAEDFHAKTFFDRADVELYRLTSSGARPHLMPDFSYSTNITFDAF